MPLQLPNLDDRRYADLVAEARRLIPTHDPDWTNHNPSDPGITLVELFAYLTEMLLYRLDRVTAENQIKFLQLLNGPDWKKTGPDLAADIRDTVRTVRARQRAVTAADFERLATEDFNQWLAERQRNEAQGESLDEWWQVTELDRAHADNFPSYVPPVARAACVPSRNLERGNEATRTENAPGHVSLIVLPQDARLSQPPASQKTALWRYLDNWRMLTTRHHVVGPYYVPISAEIVIACTSDASLEEARKRVVSRLQTFLSALDDASQNGWPFGRDVYVSELYQQIEAIEGIDYITDLMLFSACQPSETQCAVGLPLWHPEGDLVGIGLEQHHLPLERFDPDAIVLAPNSGFVPVQVAVTLTGAGDPAKLKVQAKEEVRKFFHPLHREPGPGGPTDRDLAHAKLQAALQAIPEVTAVALQIETSPDREIVKGGQVCLHLAEGEIVNWQTGVTVQDAEAIEN